MWEVATDTPSWVPWGNVRSVGSVRVGGEVVDGGCADGGGASRSTDGGVRRLWEGLRAFGGRSCVMIVGVLTALRAGRRGELGNVSVGGGGSWE